MDSDRNNLTHIIDISRRISTLCSNKSSNSISESLFQQVDAPAQVPPLVLPLPEDITQSLTNTGCSLSLAKVLNDTFIRSAHKIRTMYLSIHHRQVERLASDPDTLASITALRQAVERQYNAQLHTIQCLAVDRGKSLQLTSRSGNGTTKTKSNFNQEFVPFLEKYFEYNAYPSAPDRISLARKSMMTPRQIEVWFQNHRNRAKKEGKILQRLDSNSLPLNMSLESLEENMPHFLIPERNRKDHIEMDTSEQSSNEDSDDTDNVSPIYPVHTTFSNSSPPHAFPNTYPPITNYTPFPRDYKPPPPVWTRARTTTATPSRSTVDIEELITNFSTQLSIRDSPPKNHDRASSLPGLTAKRPWFAATYTIPPSAPHPALIRSCPPESTFAPMIPLIATPSSSRHLIQFPIPPTHPATMAPSSKYMATFKKVARLPKRMLKLPGTIQCRVGPAVREDPPTPSSRSFTPSSRTSSFSSDDSFHTPSSPSSSSSTASSTPSTPIFSPTSLPESTALPVSIPSFDFENMLDLFGNPSNNLLPLDLHSHINSDFSTSPKTVHSASNLDPRIHLS